jgi:hypothetical protein
MLKYPQSFPTKISNKSNIYILTTLFNILLKILDNEIRQRNKNKQRYDKLS